MIKLHELMGKSLLKERLNMMLSRVVLLIEGRLSDFRKKYRQIPQDIMDIFVENDPSGTNKYLDWLGRVVVIQMYESNFTEDDAQNLMNWISIFHKKGRGVDIYSFKDLDSFIEYISKKDKELSKRATVKSQASILFVNDYIKVVAPETHEASRHFGGSTRWCISTSNEGYWTDYYCEKGNSIVFVIFRKQKEKYAIVGDDPNYSAFYNDRNHIIGRIEKQELINKLQNETNAEGENAWDAIESHFEYDDRDDRETEYRDKKLQDDFEDYGQKELDKSLKKILADEILNLSNANVLDEKWEDYTKSAFGSLNEYTSFLNRIWTESAIHYGYESAGTIKDMDDVKRFDEGLHEDEINKLINIIRSDIIDDTELDLIIQNVLSVDAYYKLVNDDYEEYAAAIRDVRQYLENTLNNPSQTLFPFGGKLKPTVKSFEELIRLMDKLDHTKIAMKILQYASGKYKKGR